MRADALVIARVVGYGEGRDVAGAAAVEITGGRMVDRVIVAPACEGAERQQSAQPVDPLVTAL